MKRTILELVEAMRRNPKAVRFTPWPGDSRVNIQQEKGFAKAYQVRQVLKAIDKLEDPHEAEQ